MSDEPFNGKDRQAINAIRSAIEDLSTDVKDLRQEVQDVRERTVRIEANLLTVDDDVDDHEDRVRSLETARNMAHGGWKTILFVVSASSVIGGVVGAVSSLFL